jgi:hypothetical protein
MIWQKSFLSQLIPLCHKLSNYLGTAALGSWAYGDYDEYSDLDLLIIHKNKTRFDLKTIRQLAHGCGELIASYGGEHLGKDSMLICLYDNPVRRVDLTAVTLQKYVDDQVQLPKIIDDTDGLLKKVESQINGHYPPVNFQRIEDRFWVWIINAAQKVRRGDLFEAINYLSSIRKNALLKLIHALNGSEPRGYRSLHTIAPGLEKRLHPTHPKEVNMTELSASLKATIDCYLLLRAKLKLDDLNRNDKAQRAAEEIVSSII